MTDVIDAFEQDDVFHSSTVESVIRPSRQSALMLAGAGIRSTAFVQDAVTANALVHNGEARIFRIGMKRGREKMGPAMIFVVRAALTVGNAVTESNDGGIGCGCHDI